MPPPIWKGNCSKLPDALVTVTALSMVTSKVMTSPWSITLLNLCLRLKLFNAVDSAGINGPAVEHAVHGGHAGGGHAAHAGGSVDGQGRGGGPNDRPMASALQQAIFMVLT